jgi:hypothetical protein
MFQGMPQWRYTVAGSILIAAVLKISLAIVIPLMSPLKSYISAAKPVLSTKLGLSTPNSTV